MEPVNDEGDDFVLPMISAKFSTIFDEKKKLKQRIAQYDPIKSAAIVASLLTLPQFHRNVLRVEFLLHLLLIFGRGKKIISESDISDILYNQIENSSVSRLEDPLEDVFVSNVVTKEGNARIFMGLWENSGFFLQRILNIVETFPQKGPFPILKKQVYSLVRISEEIARRLDIPRNTVAPQSERKHPKVPPLSALKNNARAISFSEKELIEIGINPSELLPFILAGENVQNLESQEIGNSNLEFRPIIKNGDRWIVLLPTSISIAIRHHLFSWMLAHPFLESFNAHIVREYVNFLHEIPFFGRPIPKEVLLAGTIVVNKNFIIEAGVEIDKGFYVQLVVLVDSINIPYNQSFIEHKSLDPELTSYAENSIIKCIKEVSSKDGFRHGLTLVIGCGLGHATIFEIPKESDKWAIEFVSAPDLETLAWKSIGAKFLIWQVSYFRQFLKSLNFQVSRSIGLLPLAGWLESSRYLLDSDIPFHQAPMYLHIGTDFVFEIRKKVKQDWDVQALPHTDGTNRIVRCSSGKSNFLEIPSPRYVCINSILAGRLSNAWEGDKVVWWIEVSKHSEELSRDGVFKIWDATANWIERIAPICELKLPEIGKKPVLISLNLENLKNDQVDPIDPEAIEHCIDLNVKNDSRTIDVNIRDPFWGGFRHPKNYAERALVTTLVRGILRLAGRDDQLIEIESIVNQIVPNEDARHIHLFQAITFRDHLSSFDDVSPLLLDEMVSARVNLNLGWQAQKPPYRDVFSSEKESNKFIHDLVDFVWSQIKSDLELYNRQHFIEEAFRRIEGIESEKLQWERAMKAMFALNQNKATIQDTALEKIGRFNSSKIALRILIEMAVCQCPSNNGRHPADIEFQYLISKALQIFQFGGWSDAIMKGVMEPEIKIAPSGEVRAHVGFRETVLNPYGEHSATILLNQAAESYDKSYKPFAPVERVEDVFPPQFVRAFEVEFGISIDQLRAIRTALEDLSLINSTSVYSRSKKDILAFCQESHSISEEQVNKILDRFSLWTRPKFDKAPKGFENKDWYPWRFGRRLSVMSRPIIKIGNDTNPAYVVSPGQLGESIAYIFQRYANAEIDPSECYSEEMKSWIDGEIQRRGHSFAESVFNLVKIHGYQARLELAVTELLAESNSINYGDVDVFAWRPSDGKILCIECKNLKSAKTSNEVAEQLNRFSGQYLNGNRDDLLKHLDRCSLLAEKKIALSRFTGIPLDKLDFQGVVCFSKPVPMMYISKKFPKISFKTIDDMKLGA